MTTPTDVSPPADAAQPAADSRTRRSRPNLALAWVGIVAGGLFIVGAIFLAGFFLSSSLGGPWGDHMASGPMDCCDHMTPGQPMKPGSMPTPAQMPSAGMMSPGGHMAPGHMMPGKGMGPS